MSTFYSFIFLPLILVTRETEMFIKKLNLFIFKKYSFIIAKEEMLWLSNINSRHQYGIAKYMWKRKEFFVMLWLGL